MLYIPKKEETKQNVAGDTKMQERDYVYNKMIFKEIIKLEEALDTLSGIISHKEALKVRNAINEYEELLKDS